VKRGLLERFGERGLKLGLATFFLALAIPSAVLITQAYSQLKWSAFRSTQLAAEELAARIDAALRVAVASEDARSFGDYSFLVAEGNATANFVQRSPLSAFPVVSAVPAVLGYFQVDDAGRFTTPLLPAAGVAPASYGIAPAEEAARAARVAEIGEVLASNRLVRGALEDGARAELEQRDAESDASASGNESREAPRRRRVQAAESNERAAEAPQQGRSIAPSSNAPVVPQFRPSMAPASDAQAAFDRLTSSAAPASPAPQPPAGAAENSAAGGLAAAEEPVAQAQRYDLELFRQKRVEQALVAEPAAAPAPNAVDEAGAAKLELSVRTFESEIDPFEIGVLDTGHLVLFRNVWRDGKRYVQGALIDREAFVAETVAIPYRASSVGGVSHLAFAYRGRALDELRAIRDVYQTSAQELAGTLLQRVRLSPPFGDFELEFTLETLPRSPGSSLLAWIAVTLAIVLCGGFFTMYRFAIGQLRLARQQRDFISAVSHELKTPLTSIRMYGEMLKGGWADDAKKRVYYDYIHSESERLSRLIENVLELARLTRSKRRLELRPTSVAELMDMVRSKVATQVERAGFVLTVRDETTPDATAIVDADAFAQIFINLVDNALKFSAGAAQKVVELACRRESDGSLLFTVRDFGPGVPKAQMKKIFELFYRPGDARTRETAGTGIGLALVRELAAAMRAEVDVRNCDPGAEFRLRLPTRR
jgi:two-component system, OmpR family, phosphate regulon sensor histidine kinase PhoR